MINEKSMYKYVHAQWCMTNLIDKKIYIFGAGVDGEKTYKKLSEKLKIEAFIDNKRYGGLYCSKPIISLKDYKEVKNENTIIILAAYRYANEMAKQLVSEGLISGEEFVIWDDMNILSTDEASKKYANFMREIWQEKAIDSKREIIIPFDNRHDCDTVMYAYCANYYAQKENASIWGFCRYGAKADNASPVLLDIYKSINMKGLINPVLDEDGINESNRIFDEVWENLYTWEDWKNIEVYGIEFGTAIITDYLREKIPCFNLRDDDAKSFIKETISTIVFWYKYFNEHDVKCVLSADGNCWEAYISEIALKKEIPVYAIYYTMQKVYPKFHFRTESTQNYKLMWNELSEEEKEYGIKWAKQHIEERVKGSTNDLDPLRANNYSFSLQKKEGSILEKNNKLKVVIFPHIFEEASYQYGEHIFDNSYMSWLCHLGELSEKTPEYDWYIKMHPAARRRDPIIINRLIERYPRIKMLPSGITPVQLKEEGVKFALTVSGTIGHELPAIGIEVINAGKNLHGAFDFTWNPKSKSEYDELLLNLPNLKPKNNLEDLYIFYAMHYLYFDKVYIDWKSIFFKNPYLAMQKEFLELYGKEYGTWKYEEYMKDWSEEYHNNVLEKIPELFKMMDEWNPITFYRRKDTADVFKK